MPHFMVSALLASSIILCTKWASIQCLGALIAKSPLSNAKRELGGVDGACIHTLPLSLTRSVNLGQAFNINGMRLMPHLASQSEMTDT